MSKIKNNQFLQVAINEVPRLLGQLNRNPSSRSYGSFDRAYWHYRTNDISSCRYQEALYTLTLLYCSNFEGNEYYHDKKLFEWIRACLVFTASIQKHNGSFDEWYLNEGSYVGTAFLTAALCQTILLLRKDKIAIVEDELICTVVDRASHFLMKQDEKTAMNQVSGAIFAIAASDRLCNLPEFGIYAKNLLDTFLSTQSKEGWWSEYGGPDIGYLSLTISYLAKYKKLTGENKINNSIGKARKFIEYFINPDHTAGGEYMSRNTEYIIPSSSLPYLGTVKPAYLDDRYLCYILYNWIETGLEVLPQIIKISHSEDYFSESSLLRVVNKNYFLVINGKKGGSFRLYAKGKVYYDSGLEITSTAGNFSTGILDSDNHVSFQGNHFLVSGVAKSIKEPLLDTKTVIIFKLWQLLFGKLLFLQVTIKNFLRSRMVSYSKGSNISYERSFEYHPQAVVVTDTVYWGTTKGDIVLGMKSAYSAVPSSKYVAVPETSSRRLLPELVEQEEGNRYIIKRVFNIKNL